MVTLASVARLSGTSAATVTRALHGHPRVLPTTRARVEEAARVLGYVPHLGARALATRTTETFGLLIPSTADSFWGEVAAGLEERAIAQGYATLLATSHGSAQRERGMMELFLGKRVDGIVVGGAAAMPTTWFPRGRPTTPIVLVNWNTPFDAAHMAAARVDPVSAMIRVIERRIREAPFPHVATDEVGGAARAVRYLMDQGHRAIAFAGIEPIRPALLRFLGMRGALEERGLRPAAVIACPDTLEGGQQAGNQLAGLDPRPTAVVAFDDIVAVGIIRAVHAAGLRVPEDVSVVGFDDVEVAAFVEPPLTTVRQAKEALGTLAVDVILGALRGTPVKALSLLPAELVIRQSTGPLVT